MQTLRARGWTPLLLTIIVSIAGAPAALAAIDDPDWHAHVPGEPWPDLAHKANLALGAGAGLHVDGGFAYVTAQDDGFHVVDVSIPETPVLVSTLTGISPRDADLLTLGTQRVAVLAQDGQENSKLRMLFVDVTDPATPQLLSSFAMPREDFPQFNVHVHNVAVVTGTTLVYNARSAGTGIDIVDASDPTSPSRVKVWTDSVSIGSLNYEIICHDIMVFADAGRAYCAGSKRTWILDITDPLDPETVGVIQNNGLDLHHWAIPSPSHDLLLIGDEHGSGCYGVPSPAPEGAVWIYDISDPANAVLKSWVEAPDMAQGASDHCTAHFGGLVNDHTVAVGWYAAGVLLIDFQNPSFPVIVEQWKTPDTDVWDVRHADGYLFTGDTTRGFDVLRVVCGPAGAGC